MPLSRTVEIRFLVKKGLSFFFFFHRHFWEADIRTESSTAKMPSLGGNTNTGGSIHAPGMKETGLPLSKRGRNRETRQNEILTETDNDFKVGHSPRSWDLGLGREGRPSGAMANGGMWAWEDRMASLRSSSVKVAHALVSIEGMELGCIVNPELGSTGSAPIVQFLGPCLTAKTHAHLRH
jgi:hypothetical protein